MKIHHTRHSIKPEAVELVHLHVKAEVAEEELDVEGEGRAGAVGDASGERDEGEGGEAEAYGGGVCAVCKSCEGVFILVA